MNVTPGPSNNEDDVDIYGDLPEANLSSEGGPKLTNEEVEVFRKQTQKELEALRKNVTQLTEKNIILATEKYDLDCNISVLYKTAIAEIKRKDRTIAELRKEIDDISFRRSNRKPSYSVLRTDATVQRVDFSSLNENLKHQSKGKAENIVCEPEVVATNKQSVLTIPVDCSKDSKEEVKESELFDKNKEKHTFKDHPKKRNVNKENPVAEESETVAIQKSLQCTLNAQSRKPKMSVSDRLGVKRESPQSNSISSSEFVHSNKENEISIGSSNSINDSCDANFDHKREITKDRNEHALEENEQVFLSKEECSALEANAPIQGFHGLSKNNVSISHEDVIPVVSEPSIKNLPCEYGSLPLDLRRSSRDQLESSHNIPRKSSNEKDICSLSTTDAGQLEEHIGNFENIQIQDSNENKSAPSLSNSPSIERLQQVQNSECISNEYSIVPSEDNPQRSPLSEDESSVGESKLLLPVHPPLPKEDPAPLPPLPLTSPPPTPMKEEHMKLKFESKMAPTNMEDGAKVSNSPKEINDTDGSPLKRSSLKTADQDRKKFSRSLPLITSSPNNVSQNSNENLLMQCPFKPRRRAKSIVVLEDLPITDNDESTAIAKTSQSSHVSFSKCKSPESKFKRTPLKKYDVQENRLASDYRHYQMQRSAYSSRHLSSVKCFSHMPERRSPSELLNGRSGRIVRLAHQDKIRSRDRRSRSLSPNNRNLRQVRYQTRNVSNNIARDLQRRNFMDERPKKSEKKEEWSKPKTLRLKKQQESRSEKEESKVKSKSNSKMRELFGESSPEPEENPCRSSSRNSKSLDKAPKVDNSKPSEIRNNPDMKLLKNGEPQDFEEEHIIVKRRPRSSIYLANSENFTNVFSKAQDCPVSVVNESQNFVSKIANCSNKPHQDKIQNLSLTKTQLVQTRDYNLKRSYDVMIPSDECNVYQHDCKLLNLNSEVPQGRPFKKRK